MKDPNALIGSLCAIGCETLFGLSYLFTKTATQTASAFALLSWRFLTAAVVMTLCVWAGVIPIRLRGKPLKPLLLVALYNPCLYFIGETMGISHTTASESGAFLACIPVASLLASACLLHKKPARSQIVGILLTLLGVLITVFAASAASSLSAAGYAFLLVAVVVYALYSVSVEKANGYSGAEITYVMMLVGAAVLGAVAVAEGLLNGTLGEWLRLPFENSAFRTAVLYQGIGCSTLAFFLSNVAIRRIGVNRTSSFIGVSTVVSIIAGALLLQETFTLWQGAGAAVILLGVSIANGGKRS